MVPHLLVHATSHVAILVSQCGPKIQKTCDEWVQRGLSVQPNKCWTMSVICGIGGTIELNISAQIPAVQDATAPPQAKTARRYVVAPMMLTCKARKARRRRRRGDNSGNHDNDDGDDGSDGPDWDEGGFGGSGGWGGNSDDGRGGNDYWDNYSGSWWEDAGDAAVNFVYQVACWISLSQCLQFVLRKVIDLVKNSSGIVVDDPSTDAPSFAQCSSLFACPNAKEIKPVAENMTVTWPTPSYKL